MYNNQIDTNVLKWVAYDSNLKPAQYDQGFKQWAAKGITAWCVLDKEGASQIWLKIWGHMNSKDTLTQSREVNGVIQNIIKAYKESNIRIISVLYQGLTNKNKHSTKYIKGEIGKRA